MRLPDGIRRLFRLGMVRPQVSQDLDDELDFHFEEAVHDLVNRGLTEAEARGVARAQFGDEQAYRYRLERIDDGRVRIQRASELLHTCVRTVALALRRIRRAPGFSTSVVVILTLGIGVNAMMFGVVDRLLLSPPQHVADPDDVHLLHVRRRAINPTLRLTQEIATFQALAYPDVEDLFEVEAFAGVAAYSSASETTVDQGEAAHRVRTVRVSSNFFSVLGTQPAFGRFFADREPLSADPTAILAEEYWTRAYGRDPNILGRTIDVGTRTLTIIGIAPAGFTGAELEPVDVWRHLRETGCTRGRECYSVRGVARLTPGATVESALAEATARHRGGRGEMIARGYYDATAEIMLAPVIAARGPSPTSEAVITRWLAGVSLVVLLIACFNVANLLLARSIQTRREITVRLALGASRARIINELVTESLVLAGMGAGAALLLAEVLGGTLHDVLLPNVAFTDAGLGARLLGFTLVATLVAGLLTGLIPALQASNPHLADTLRAGGHGVAGGRSKTRSALLVGQVAFSVVLLVGAGLFVRSLRSAQELDLGFDSQSIVAVTLEFNETMQDAERLAMYESALEVVRRLPGVRSAGLALMVPLRSELRVGVRVTDLDSAPQDPAGGPFVNKVSSGYFEATGMTILQGRAFEAADDVDEAPLVAVVSESMASAFWPTGAALGECMLVGNFDGDLPCTEVVGIVKDHHRMDLVENDPQFLYYLNQSHIGVYSAPRSIVVGASGDTETLIDLIRTEVGTASTQIRFVDATPISNYVESAMRSWTLGASMFTAFGFLALIVAGWGLYSVLAFDVALRHRELGIRSALGANVARLVRLVLRQAVLFVSAGVGIGLLASLAASRFVEPLLFQVSATDPMIYALVGVTLLLVAALAGSLPAWRATRVDPREALQAD